MQIAFYVTLTFIIFSLPCFASFTISLLFRPLFLFFLFFWLISFVFSIRNTTPSNDVHSHLADSSYCQMLPESKKTCFPFLGKFYQKIMIIIVKRPPYSNNSIIFFLFCVCGCVWYKALCVLSVFTLHFTWMFNVAPVRLQLKRKVLFTNDMESIIIR